MTVKDLKPANDSGTPDSPETVAESQEAPSLEELANRQQAAMAKLGEITSALDTLLEETISAVDESVAQSKKKADEIKNQAAEKAAAVLAEAQARAQKIISAAESEGKTQAWEATDLIEEARSSAGRLAKPDLERLPSLTGEIRAALEASIEQSLKSVLKDLQDLEQETRLSEGPEGPQAKSIEAGQDFATPGHSENNSGLQHSNGFKLEIDDSASSSASGAFATKPDVDNPQIDGDKDSNNNGNRNDIDDIRQMSPSAEVIDAPEAGHNGDREIPSQAGVDGSSDLAMKPGFYSGDITLVILLKKSSDERTDHLTPEQISRQIKHTPGGSVVDSGMLGKEYFIKARFETLVSLDDVLDGVSDWEDFEHQSDKVKEYQNRAWAVGASTSSKESKEFKDEKRILVTL